MELGEIAGLAREDAAETLLLHNEAGVVANKKPLKILGSHFVDILTRLVDGMIVFPNQSL